MQASPYDAAVALARAGRFADARQRLKDAGPHRDSQAAQALLAEVLEHTGAYDEAVQVAERLRRSRQLGTGLASRCAVVLGHVAMTAGRHDEALDAYRQAVSLARSAGDLEQLCWAQIRLIYGERTRIDRPDVRALLADLRANATKLGDPFVTAALHIFVGAVEGERGALDAAERHLRVADSILALHPNAWLQAETEIGWTGLSCLNDDIGQADEHVNDALRWAQVSGDVTSEAAALANISHILLAKGEFACAEDKIRQGLSICVPGGCLEVALLDSLLQAKLARQDYEECDRIAGHIRRSIVDSAGQSPFQYRWCRPTLAKVAFTRGQLRDAWDVAHAALEAANVASDRGLQVVMRSLIAHMAIELGTSDYIHLIAIARALEPTSVGQLAALERACGDAFSKSGLSGPAHAHWLRSARAFTAIGHVAPPKEVVEGVAHSVGEIRQQRATDAAAALEARCAVEAFATGAAALYQVRRDPELLGREAQVILQAAGCVHVGMLVRIDKDGAEDVLDFWGLTEEDIQRQSATEGSGFQVLLGESRQGTFKLCVALTSDLLANETALALKKILRAAVDLEQLSRNERRQAALWPLEDAEEADDSSVGVFASAKSREVAALARRTAATDVSVLITGETGTGKELMARLIHQHSARAARVFVPFNCAAVPHDMLDGQLFGHRRGAFTGAVESFQGVIRAAAGGTLFLDEIGDVPLDLQPKLLRFLESGEVHPIGEPRPVGVDVRVIAATNADLERLVAEKRFREDLYYRLNVIHIPVPALRERREEIPALARYFLQRYTEELRKSQIDLSAEAVECLSLRPWPGNVRELANAIRRAVALASPGTVLLPEHFRTDGVRWSDEPEPEAPGPASTIAINLDQPIAAALDQIERAIVGYAIHQSGGQMEAAARALGLSRKGLYLKRRRLGVEL